MKLFDSADKVFQQVGSVWQTRVVTRVSAVVSVLYVTIVSWTVLAIAGAALIMHPQSGEALRVASQDVLQRFFLVGAVILFAWVVWYWSRLLLYTHKPNLTVDLHSVGFWIPRLLGFAFYILSCVALLAARPARALVDDQRDAKLGEAIRELNAVPDNLKWLALAVFGTGLLALFVWFLADMKLLSARSAGVKLDWLTTLIVWGAVAVFVLATICFVQWPTALSILGPMAVLLSGLSGWVVIGSGLRHASLRYGFPVLGGLVVVAVINNWFNLNDNRQVRTEKMAFDLPKVGDAFEGWLASRPDLAEFRDIPDELGQPRPYPVVIVCAQGGGLRAAYQTAYALAALQDQCPAFAQHIFAISGVSGGSVGAAVFAADCFASNSPDGSPSIPEVNLFKTKAELEDVPPDSHRALIESVLSADLLSPVLGNFVFGDTVQQFIPYPIEVFDRSRSLADSLEAAWRQALPDSKAQYSTLMSSLMASFGRQSEDRGAPTLFFNTTDVYSGRRVVLSNLDLDDGVSRGVTLYALRNDVDLRLSEAAFLSARFPGVTTSGFIEPHRGYRLVDGGYADNTGLATGIEIAKAILNRYVIRKIDHLRTIHGSEDVDLEVNQAGNMASAGINPISEPFIARDPLSILWPSCPMAQGSRLMPIKLIILQIGMESDIALYGPQSALFRPRPYLSETLSPLFAAFSVFSQQANNALSTLDETLRQLPGEAIQTVLDKEFGKNVNIAKRERFLDKNERIIRRDIQVAPIQIVANESQGVLPLGWLLSNNTRTLIRRQVAPIPAKHEELSSYKSRDTAVRNAHSIFDLLSLFPRDRLKGQGTLQDRTRLRAE